MADQSDGNQQLNNLLKAALAAPENKIQAHGLTVGQMKEHHEEQRNGTEPEMITANCDPNYEIKAKEKHLVHVLLDEDRWDKGKKLSTPFMKKFYVDDFTKMSATAPVKKADGSHSFPENAFAAWKTTIIHDPRKKEKAVKETPTPANSFVLESLSEADLRKKYKEVTGNDADDFDTIQQMIDIIKEAGSKTRKAPPTAKK